MRFSDHVVHQREIHATLTEDEIHTILLAHVANAAGVSVADCLKTRAYISTQDRPGPTGKEYVATVELTTQEGVA